MTPRKNETKSQESFETLLKQLEQAVAQLEQEELPLDEAIAQYKSAMTLVAACRARLDEAEATVNVLIQNEQGEWDREPLPERDQQTHE